MLITEMPVTLHLRIFQRQHYGTKMIFPPPQGWGLYKSILHLGTTSKRPGLNTLDALRRVSVGQGNIMPSRE